MIKRGVLVLLSVLTQLLVFVAPAGAASPAAKNCADGEKITHGHFFSLLADGANCSVSNIRVGAGGTAVIQADGTLSANASTFVSDITVLGGSLYPTTPTIGDVTVHGARLGQCA